jgi:hypothetical protein
MQNQLPATHVTEPEAAGFTTAPPLSSIAVASFGVDGAG